MGSSRRLRYLACACSLLLVSCGSAADPEPQAESVDADRSIARSVEEGQPETSASDPADGSVLDDLGLNPEGVINAAVLLHSGGDADAALDAGAFTRAELDAARAGLADGSLDYLFE